MTDLFTGLDGLKQQADNFVKNWVNKENQKNSTGFILECVFTYTDINANPIYWKVRAKDPNTGDKFIRAFYSGEKGFIYKSPEMKNLYPQGKGKKPLYALDHIIKATDKDIIYILEGEQKADALNQLGLYATTCGGSQNATTTHLEPLKGRTVVIWADNDDSGMKFLNDIAKLLLELDCTVQTIDLEPLDLPVKGDVMDWIQARNEKGLYTSSQDIQALKINCYELPKTQQDDDSKDCSQNEEIAPFDEALFYFANLSEFEYEQQRIQAAKDFSIRPSVLDKMVKIKRKELDEQRQDDMFEHVEAWHNPVDGHELLNDIYTIINTHIACEHHTAIATTLWIVFTWAIDAMQIAPIACITAPEKRCGKTQLLTMKI